MKIRKRKTGTVAMLAILLAVLQMQTVNAQSIDDVIEADSKSLQEPGDGEVQSEESGTDIKAESQEDAAGEAGTQGTEASKEGNQNAGSGTADIGSLTGFGNSNTISEGVYIGTIDVSGKTAGEAKQDVEAYVEALKERTVTLHVMDENQIEVAVGDLGFQWTNPDVAQDAVALGKKGNIVQRYKALQDLRYENKVFDLSYDFDKEMIRQIVSERCREYDTEAKDAVLTRVNGVFSVTPGQSGRVVDEEASLNQIYDYMMNEWDFSDASVDMVVKVQEPRGSEEELSQVKDVLGTFTTSYSTSGSSRSANVSNGCSLIAGTTLYPGDEFSTYEAVSPFSVDNGYYMAGSYMNGQVVDSLGGGICQVSTTLYNAVLLSELEVTERHNHSMIVTYVDPSADAAIAESAGKDFKFVNNTEYPIYIDGYCENKNITFTIYGVETRPSNREVTYESEILSVINPDHEIIYTNVAMPIGQVVTQSAHIGYKAQLWKIVKENGVEVSREQINSSSYKMVPRTATVGLSTNDVNAYNEMLAAVATNNIDHVKNVAAALAQFAIPADQAPVEQPPAEQPPAEQPPAEQPPAEQPPAEQSPAEQPPAEEAPAEQPPAE
ncbi:MAG TPA: hypothetical protein DCZ40_02625 [Lachnospiraceae bacterium]|nr:hypothetical protein [Lachnospiraceae bacterium]